MSSFVVSCVFSQLSPCFLPPLPLSLRFRCYHSLPSCNSTIKSLFFQEINLEKLRNLKRSIHVFRPNRPPSHSRTQSPLLTRGATRGSGQTISNWHLIGYNEGYCSNTGYILLPCFYGIRFWIWPEPLRRTARKKGSGYENAAVHKLLVPRSPRTMCCKLC